jgi:hypothetical protein
MGAFAQPTRDHSMTNYNTDGLTEALQMVQGRLGAFAGPCLSCAGWWSRLQEPPRTGRMSKIVKGGIFESIVLVVILLNGAFIFYSTNYAAENLGEESNTSFMTAVEVFFLIVYTIELTMKLCVHGLYFFVNTDATWNCFDCMLIVFSLADLLATAMVKSNENGVNLTLLRSFRLLRISRVVRLFRALRLIRELRLMLDCLMGCVSSLLWSLMMMASINSIFGLLFVQAVTLYLTEHGHRVEPAERDLLLAYFANCQTAMITLYQATSGGLDWALPYEALDVIGTGYGMLFIFYITFNTIAVWNIMTSLFIDRAMKLANQDSDAETWNKKKQENASVKELIEVVKESTKELTGDDYEGTISLEMFDRLQEVDRFRRYFLCRGIDMKDASSFFKMLCQIEGDDFVDTEAFGYGCTRLKGNASSVDLHTHNFECKLMHQANQSWFTQFQEELETIREKLASDQSRALSL